MLALLVFGLYTVDFPGVHPVVNTAAQFCGAAAAFELLIGEPAYELCKDFVAVELAPGIQLKGKSPDTFTIYRVVAIRQDPASPWVPLPTQMAAQVTQSNVQQFRTRQTAAAASAAVAVAADAPAPGPPA